MGLLGLHEVGDGFARWWLVDVLWACVCGLGVGGALGVATARAMHRLAARGMHSELMENLLGLGLIALSYGASLLLHGYGFLAVFAAAFMLHRTEARLGAIGGPPRHAESDTASLATETAYMSQVSLHLVEQLERLAEVALLLLIGGMLFADSWQLVYVACALMLLFVVRPISVLVGLVGSREPALTELALGWFGVRGIGSIYYLMYSIQHGVGDELAVTLVSVVLVVVATSIVLHGISVTPLMRLYARQRVR